MSRPPAAGVVDANTRVTDDAEALARRRRAECHQLTVLHHIRMRGQAVISAMNTTGGPDSSTNAPSQRSQQQPPPSVQQQGRQVEHEPSTRIRPSTSHRSVHPSESGSRIPYSTTNTTHTHAEDSSDSQECRSYWCLIRDILVCYAVIGVTYLLFVYWMLTADAFTASNEEYDFIP